MNTLQDLLANSVLKVYPNAVVKKINSDNHLDIHLPFVHPKRGTHLFFNTVSGVIKIGFYCREEEFTQQILANNPDLDAYSHGIRPKGNPEFKTADAASAAALAFVESFSGNTKKNDPIPASSAPLDASSNSEVGLLQRISDAALAFVESFSGNTKKNDPIPASSAHLDASSNSGAGLLQRIKEVYPKCSVNQEKGYASFTFKAAFLYELRIQKGTIRLLAANYPQKASVEKCLELIAQYQIAEKQIQDQYKIIVEPGKVSPDKLTVKIEIPYQAADLGDEAFLAKITACCDQFHNALMPLINGFQPQHVGKLQEVMSDGSAPKASEFEKEEIKIETPTATDSMPNALFDFDLTTFDLEGQPVASMPVTPTPPQKSDLHEIAKSKEKQEKDEDDESPYILDEKKKTLYISSMPHCILFVTLQVGSKLDKFNRAEMRDIQSTAVTIGDWFDMDQDRCLKALDETLELLEKCKTIFNTEEIEALVLDYCLVINREEPNVAVREDIIRGLNDLANADGKLTHKESLNLITMSYLIRGDPS